MNKLLNIFRIIFITTIGFSFYACSDSSGNPDDIKTPAEPVIFNDITASQLVANIKVGWNLGNSLDATDDGAGWLPTSIKGMEEAWGNPQTTKALITAVKNAGFNAIRIPVTWSKAVDSNYIIRSDWMTRVTEIVNYAVDNDMYIFLNTHHDDHYFKYTNSEVNASINKFKKTWEQIVDNFKNYNEKLIFEGLNEPRIRGCETNDGCYKCINEWNGGDDELRNNLNKHYNTFIDTVRSSGGNNGKRILMINTYAASISQNALNGLVLPTDTVANKLIASVHMYEPWSFAAGDVLTWDKNNQSDTDPITQPIERIKTRFLNNGIPVIVGEFGSPKRTPDNTASRAEWAKYYVKAGMDASGVTPMRFIWWDNGPTHDANGLFNRATGAIVYPTIINAMMEVAVPPAASVETTAVFKSWETAFDEGGGASITYSTTNSRHKITGIKAGWGVNVTATPDSVTLTKMKTMTSLSFMVKGDNNEYSLLLSTPETSTVYNEYRKTFNASGTDAKINVSIPSGLSQGWDSDIPFNQNNITNIILIPVNNGNFELEIWDIKITN